MRKMTCYETLPDEEIFEENHIGSRNEKRRKYEAMFRMHPQNKFGSKNILK